MIFTSYEQAQDAARILCTSGPIGELGAGPPLGCFAPLRLALGAIRQESLATEAILHMPDGPDDPFMETGKREVAEITSAIGSLLNWADIQLCRVEVCECRADRLLRRLLEESMVPSQTGFSRTLGRNNCLIAGRFDARSAERSAYVLIEHRNQIEHAVRGHRGWRARGVTGGVSTTVYESPAYPHTPVSVYREDTLACVGAVAGALRSA
ncbi:hypothetical protein [Streptomyces sp. CAU 1734]|uniref:hypothetical protein n=1 Tax=Streptomyces sp. CAU 1734 TaxID=3140360 RepID=UPI0032606CD3